MSIVFRRQNILIVSCHTLPIELQYDKEIGTIPMQIWLKT
jgi:hypothetical protein